MNIALRAQESEREKENIFIYYLRNSRGEYRAKWGTEKKTYGNIFGTKATFHSQTPNVTLFLSLGSDLFLCNLSQSPACWRNPQLRDHLLPTCMGIYVLKIHIFTFYFFRIGNYETSSREETKVIQLDFSSSLYVLIPSP